MNKSTDGFNLLIWIKRRYLLLSILFLSLYVFFAFAAPILMNRGLEGVAQPIYRFYSNLCHQYGYRSWFLFGEQAAYPLQAQNGSKSIYDVFDLTYEHPEISREIIGSPSTGYKTAICQRDVALYGALLLFALLFALSGRKIKSLHFALWFLLAVVPIGVDGLLQLAGSYGYLGIQYESTALMRTITGSAFGFFSGWLLFPAIEVTLQREKKNS